MSFFLGVAEGMEAALDRKQRREIFLQEMGYKRDSLQASIDQFNATLAQRQAHHEDDMESTRLDRIADLQADANEDAQKLLGARFEALKSVRELRTEAVELSREMKGLYNYFDSRLNNVNEDDREEFLSLIMSDPDTARTAKESIDRAETQSKGYLSLTDETLLRAFDLRERLKPEDMSDEEWTDIVMKSAVDYSTFPDIYDSWEDRLLDPSFLTSASEVEMWETAIPSIDEAVVSKVEDNPLGQVQVMPASGVLNNPQEFSANMERFTNDLMAAVESGTLPQAIEASGGFNPEDYKNVYTVSGIDWEGKSAVELANEALLRAKDSDSSYQTYAPLYSMFGPAYSEYLKTESPEQYKIYDDLGIFRHILP